MAPILPSLFPVGGNTRGGFGVTRVRPNLVLVAGPYPGLTMGCGVVNWLGGGGGDARYRRSVKFDKFV